MTTLMWFAAADIKCGHKVPVWHLQIKYMTVPYICKTRHAYNTTATEETPQKMTIKNKTKNKPIRNDSIQTSAKTHERKKRTLQKREKQQLLKKYIGSLYNEP